MSLSHHSRYIYYHTENSSEYFISLLFHGVFKVIYAKFSPGWGEALGIEYNQVLLWLHPNPDMFALAMNSNSSYFSWVRYGWVRVALVTLAWIGLNSHSENGSRGIKQRSFSYLFVRRIVIISSSHPTFVLLYKFFLLHLVFVFRRSCLGPWAGYVFRC